MISETTFAQDHTSTWRLLAPTMDLFVRKINLELYEREFRIMNSEVMPARRGLINEIAFEYFRNLPVGEGDVQWSQVELDYAVYEARKKISLLEAIEIELIALPTELELTDCAEQIRRLRFFFEPATQKAGGIEFRPRFPGAGIIAGCEGDIYFERTLFEIKAGHRPFKSVDLKQLLTYATLNYAAGSRPLDRLGLFNPRMGTSFTATLDTVSFEVSGCPAVELLTEIIRVISGGDISR